jgi:hypothetical protein
MVKTTEPQRPDHGTIGKLARRRDYPMSTYGSRPYSRAQVNRQFHDRADGGQIQLPTIVA